MIDQLEETPAVRIDRRSFLAIAQAGVWASLAGGIVRPVRAHNVTLAERPWSAAPEAKSADPRIRAAAFAILAPSAFNSQPWLVKLPRDDILMLRCDLACRLPNSDPCDRMMTISLGSFLELLRMAAAEQGYRVEIEPFPLGEPGAQLDDRPIASVKFIRGDAIQDPLFAQVLERRTCRRPFEKKLVDAHLLRQICAVAPGRVGVESSNNPKFVNRIALLAFQAFEVEKRTPRMNQEQIRLIRLGDEEAEASPDGLDLNVPEVDAAVCGGVSIRALLADPESLASHLQINRYRRLCESAVACVWLSTEGNTRRDQLEAGRDWLRLHLKATELGLSLEPQSPALNDYPEMHDMFGLLHDTLGAHSGRRIQMLSRVGYAQQMAPTARWPVESRILRS
jgi:hypothetical protein